MNWLARLKNQKGTDAHATKPTKPPEQAGWVSSVGFVAYPPAPFRQIEGREAAANDDTNPASDHDRSCWPHSVAWNSKEIDTFTAMLGRFIDKGASYDNAERLADRQVFRDREADDRRLCLECLHLQGVGRWRCANWELADVAKEALAPAFVLMLQRCSGFSPANEGAAQMKAAQQG